MKSQVRDVDLSECGDTEEAALRFLYGLVEHGDGLAMPAILEELAYVFASEEAGITGPLHAPYGIIARGGREQWSGAWPWEADASLCQQALDAVSAFAVTSPQGSWLLAPAWGGLCDGQLFWLRTKSERAWTTGERSAFYLAAQAVARLAREKGDGERLRRVLERARRQKELEQAAIVTGRLAHDFSNILTGILGFTELSLTQVVPDSQAQKYMKEVWQAAQQGASWLQRVQMFCRRNPPLIQPASLAEAVAVEEERLRPLCNDHVSLQVSLPEPLPPLAVNADALKMLLAELLSNAREAISGHGVIALSAREVSLSGAKCGELLGQPQPGRNVEILISDTGTGMPAGVGERIWREVFFSTKARRRGLGLAMVHGLLQTFRGGIELLPGPEKGTTVRVFLPVAESSKELSTAQAAPSNLNQCKLLLVDDDPRILDSMSRALERAGYRVRVAPSASEAINLYTAPGEPFGLVISDIGMPVMNGFEMVRKLLRHDANLNVLFISSHAPQAGSEQDIVKRFSLLRKPFEPQSLVQAVGTALRRGAVAH